MTTVDLIIKNAQVFNVYLKKFVKQDVSIKNGKFYWINEKLPNLVAKKTIDLTGHYLIPGFVDAHMHIDSSMTTPKNLGDTILKYGTTTIIADDHEVANVAGIRGLKNFISESSVIDIFFGIPSSVPSTNLEMETTGGTIGVDEIKTLLKNPKVVCLGEVMNFKDMTSESSTLIKKIIAVCHNMRPTMPLEGHIPSYIGEDLAKVLFSGITTDHTQQTKEWVDEKIRNGMFVEIQKKAMHQEVIDTIIQNNYFEHIALVTDDSMPDTLLKGHLNLLVKEAISKGMSPEQAIYISTYTPARHMGLWDRGAIAPGRVADFIDLSNLDNLIIENVYKNGKIVKIKSKRDNFKFDSCLLNTVKAPKLNKEDLKLKTNLVENGKVIANVIQLNEVGTFTNHAKKVISVKKGIVESKEAGLNLILVQERYGKRPGYTLGLVDSALKRDGAIGSTWAHDHHNIMVIGTNIDSMIKIQHKLIDIQGGYIVAKGDNIEAIAPLPIGGVVSPEPISILGNQIKKIRKCMVELGYKNTNEIMSFSTLSLLVSPALKISNRGIFEVKSQKRIPLLERI